jgi:hypothetical protein
VAELKLIPNHLRVRLLRPRRRRTRRHNINKTPLRGSTIPHTFHRLLLGTLPILGPPIRLRRQASLVHRVHGHTLLVLPRRVGKAPANTIIIARFTHPRLQALELLITEAIKFTGRMATPIQARRHLALLLQPVWLLLPLSLFNPSNSNNILALPAPLARLTTASALSALPQTAPLNKIGRRMAKRAASRWWLGCRRFRMKWSKRILGPRCVSSMGIER